MAVSIDPAKRGRGSIRERLLGVWGDPGGRRLRPDSLAKCPALFHGSRGQRGSRAATAGVGRRLRHQPHRLCVGGVSFDPWELLERFFSAPHLWNPATVASHKHVVRALVEDSLGRRRLVSLTPSDVRAAICRWQSAGQSVSTVSSRWLVLRSALSWAVSESVLRSNPLAA
jgi:hypothetical protein